MVEFISNVVSNYGGYVVVAMAVVATGTICTSILVDKLGKMEGRNV